MIIKVLHTLRLQFFLLFLSMSSRTLILFTFLLSVHPTSAMTTSEDNSPPSLASAPEPDLDTNVDSNPSSVNDETVAPMFETSDNEPIVPSSEADSNSSNTATKETNSEQENASKEATEKTSSANTSNKPVSVSKPKTSRDKNGGSVVGGRVTSKSHVTGSESGGAGAGGTSRKPAPNSQAGMAGNYILEPDPKVNGAFYSTRNFRKFGNSGK